MALFWHNFFITFFIVGSFPIYLCTGDNTNSDPMTKDEKHELKEEARDMFYHAYRAYMENAYPADELMPLSCAGRYRGLGPSRGDIDESMGNFSLTLIDTLDTLVVLGDFEEFEHAVQLVLKDVSFDNDIVVSVFETNIRVLGGLISAHILAEYLQQRAGIMPWYRGELLTMAKELGFRLLPAFNTTTGIPYARINLKYGIKNDKLETFRETCTACAGTIILEMAALSRLTGEPIFEEKAQRAMDELWKMRHRSSDLMGTVLNVHSGDWIRRDSGVGAGIDSYYEYCLKAYILLGDDKYLARFNRHYSAVMKYISQGPMLLDVHMHRPHTNSRNYMDALLAFWPGLQVLKGDIKPAVETHEMLYQVMQRHNFIPEAFTTDFQVHWGQHPLRPEFLESTYFLYKATNDPYYLHVGKRVLKSLQKYARVPCGYAAVNDVRTGKHEDRMDSFVLAETFKYLFLLFAEPDELVLDLDEFLFTTEAHLLPLTLASYGNSSKLGNKNFEDFNFDDSEFSRACPNSLHLFPATVRRPLKNMVDDVCPRRLSKRRLTAAEFQVSNLNHLKIIKDMGINIIALNDGRIQLLHSFSSNEESNDDSNLHVARNPSDAEEGLLFMQEMVELSKIQSQQNDALPQAVSFNQFDKKTQKTERITVRAGPSHFGIEMKNGETVKGETVLAQPFRVCGEAINGERMKGKIVIMERGDCMFIEKARKIQKYGAIGGIVLDNTPGSSVGNSPLFAMSGDGTDDIKIPVVFLFAQDATKLLTALTYKPNTEVTISEFKNTETETQASTEESMFQKLKLSVQDFLSKGIGNSFTKTVTVKDLKATIGPDQIEISLIPTKNDKINTETLYNQWKIVKIGPFTLMGNNNKDFILPISVLKIYYRSLTSNDPEDDVVTQTNWFLTSLSEALQQNQITFITENFSDNILELVPNKEVLLELLHFKGTSSKIRLEKIHSLLESINELEKTIIKELQKRGNDDLIISNPNEKSGLVIEGEKSDEKLNLDLDSKNIESEKRTKSNNEKIVTEKKNDDIITHSLSSKDEL